MALVVLILAVAGGVAAFLVLGADVGAGDDAAVDPDVTGPEAASPEMAIRGHWQLDVPGEQYGLWISEDEIVFEDDSGLDVSAYTIIESSRWPADDGQAFVGWNAMLSVAFGDELLETPFGVNAFQEYGDEIELRVRSDDRQVLVTTGSGWVGYYDYVDDTETPSESRNPGEVVALSGNMSKESAPFTLAGGLQRVEFRASCRMTQNIVLSVGVPGSSPAWEETLRVVKGEPITETRQMQLPPGDYQLSVRLAVDKYGVVYDAVLYEDQ